MNRKLLLALLGAALTLSAAAAEAQVYVRIGPPPPVREVVPVRPVVHPNWVWQPGYHPGTEAATFGSREPMPLRHARTRAGFLATGPAAQAAGTGSTATGDKVNAG